MKTTVGEEDIAAVVSQWTGVPLKKMLRTEAQKILELGDRLRDRVAGQDDAVDAVAEVCLKYIRAHEMDESP